MKGLLIGAVLLHVLNAQPQLQPYDPANDPSVGVVDFDGDGPGFVDDNDNPFWYGGVPPSPDTTTKDDNPCRYCVWDLPSGPIMKKRKKRKTTDPYADVPSGLPRGRYARRQEGPEELGGFAWPGGDDDIPGWVSDIQGTRTRDYGTPTATVNPGGPNCPATCVPPTPTSSSTIVEPTDTTIIYDTTTTFVTETSVTVVTETVDPTDDSTTADPTGGVTSTDNPPNPTIIPNNGVTLQNLCPKQCNPESGKNKCHPTTSCVTSTGVYPSSYFCMCRAGFRSSFNSRDFARQFRVLDPNTQAYVRVEEGLPCDVQCSDSLCTEVMIRDQCLRV